MVLMVVNGRMEIKLAFLFFLHIVLFGCTTSKHNPKDTFKLASCPFNATVMYNNDVKGLPVTRTCSSEYEEKPYIELFWDKPELLPEAQYYIVRLFKYPYESCIGFNVSMETRLVFAEEDEFVEKEDYWASIDAFPRTSSPILSKMIPVGSCPWTGSWGGWMNWTHCDASCQDNNNNNNKNNRMVQSTRTRSRYCFAGDGNTYLDSHECRGNDVENEQCVVECKIGIKAASDSSDTDTTITVSVQIGIAFGVLSVCLIAVPIIYAKCQREITVNANNCIRERTNVYISHITSNNDVTQERKLLNLIQYIAPYGVKPTIDILCQVEINSAGGLHNWVPQSVMTADTVIIILTKKYIQALNSTDEKEISLNEQVCKIHTEYNLIKKKLYQSRQQSPKLVILKEDKVKTEHVPRELCGRTVCKYPSKYKDDDELCNKIIGLLLDTEPVQLEDVDLPHQQLEIV